MDCVLFCSFSYFHDNISTVLVGAAAAEWREREREHGDREAEETQQRSSASRGGEFNVLSTLLIWVLTFFQNMKFALELRINVLFTECV